MEATLSSSKVIDMRLLESVLSRINNPISKFKADVTDNYEGDFHVDKLAPLLAAIVRITFLSENHLELFDNDKDELKQCGKAAISIYKDFIAQYPRYRIAHRAVSPILLAVAESTHPEPRSAILKSLNSIKKALPTQD